MAAERGEVNLKIEELLGLLTEVQSPEIESLKVHLEMIKQAKVDSETNEETWLGEVVDLAQRLELAIDTCILLQRHQHNKQQHMPSSSHDNINTACDRFRDITAELRNMKSDATIKCAWRIEQRYSRTTCCGSLSVAESELVGVDSQKRTLQYLLSGERSSRLVISLVGTGGVGKTSLANFVYGKAEVQQQFDCTAWISVSKSYNLEELLKCLATQIYAAEDSVIGELDSMQYYRLITCLYRSLYTKRYLIVFDDVCHQDFWKDMRDFLPFNDKGSRVIITTRDNAIAAFASDFVLSLQPLSEEKAFELFCNKTFRRVGIIGCPLELEGLSFEIVRRCHGLPLIISAIADLLLKNPNVIPQWEELLPHLNIELVDHPFLASAVSRIFYTSYSDLPSHIRPCFLYFGVFPRDYLIPDRKLIKLWIAEGFIKQKIGMTLEQVAEAYLNELINRNLVEVSYTNYYSTERMCRVYGFMHEIILSMPEEFGIRPISKRKISGRKMRRLSINVDVKDDLETLQILSIYGGMKEFWETIEDTIRSVLFFNVDKLISQSFVVNLFERLKFLELLDFENAPLCDLPDEVGNLLYLKYLSLRNTQVKKLPESVGLLLNLRTLDVRNTLIQELPIHIQKLRKLQHLLASAHNDKVSSMDSVQGVRVKEGIGSLENLQTLMTMEAHTNGADVIEGLEKLRQLRWLGISKLSSFSVNQLFFSIEKMNLLESLSLSSSNDREVFDLGAISSPSPSLRRLILTCRLRKLPKWISRLWNLGVLGLRFSRLSVDPLNALEYLPNLVSLSLHRAYKGKTLHFKVGRFKKLKHLVLTDLDELRIMIIENGALPLLRELRVGPCRKKLSADFQHLRELQVLEYYDMPAEFVLRLQPGGSEHWKVEHVPSVVFHYKTQGRNYLSYKIGDPVLLSRLGPESPDSPQMSRTSSAQLSFFTDDVED